MYCNCVLSVYTAYKLSVHVNEVDKNKPLQISHFPQILGSESTKVAQTITVLSSTYSSTITVLYVLFTSAFCYFNHENFIANNNRS